MSLLNKIKNFFNKKTEIKEDFNEDSQIESCPEQVQETKELDKFDAEFHNPRLQCFYCGELIESGKIRFFKAPGQSESGAYHKRCFKKLKEGKLPGQ